MRSLGLAWASEAIVWGEGSLGHEQEASRAAGFGYEREASYYVVFLRTYTRYSAKDRDLYDSGSGVKWDCEMVGLHLRTAI